jgi:hypothetical protein
MALRQEQPIIASMFDKPPGHGGREVAPTAFWRSVLICPGVIEYPQRPSRSWVKRGLKTGPAGQRGFSAQAPARLLPADPRQSRNKIEMPVTAEQRQGVLPRQGRNLEVIPGYRDNSFVSRITANPQVRSGQLRLDKPADVRRFLAQATQLAERLQPRLVPAAPDA